jgi:chemotaxis protein MotB
MKKKHGDHGVWKVAYADFTTAMMALFLCLWLTSQDKKIKQAVERAFRNPFSSVTKESVGIIPNKDVSATYQQQGHFQSVSAVEMETMRHLSEDLSKLLKQDENPTTVKIDLTPEGLDINIFDRAHKPIFNPGTAAFTPYGSWVFGTLAWEIARYTTFRIELQGHTASQADTGGNGQDQWDLSTERANAARRKLVENGVLDRQISKVSGFANTVPMPGYSLTNEINRRVTVLLRLKQSVEALTNTPDLDRPTELPNDTPAN